MLPVRLLIRVDPFNFLLQEGFCEMVKRTENIIIKRLAYVVASTGLAYEGQL